MDAVVLVLVAFVLLAGLAVGTLVGAVLLRAAVALYNRMAGGARSPRGVPEPDFTRVPLDETQPDSRASSVRESMSLVGIGMSRVFRDLYPARRKPVKRSFAGRRCAMHRGVQRCVPRRHKRHTVTVMAKGSAR